LLAAVRVASPCSMRWEDMEGTDRVRHCGQCDLNVYDLSEMSAHEAEGVLRSAEGRMCIRLYRREDGTVLTRDCAVGVRAARRRLARVSLRVAAILGFVLTGGYLARSGTPQSGRLIALRPIDRLSALVRQYLPGAAPPPRPPQIELGRRALSPRP